MKLDDLPEYDGKQNRGKYHQNFITYITKLESLASTANWGVNDLVTALMGTIGGPLKFELEDFVYN